MGTAPITLLTARTTNGTPGGVDWNGGPGLLSIYGTWDTATVQLAYSPDGGTTYIDTDGLLFSAANATMLVSFPAGKVRATVATAGGTTNLNAKLESTRPPSVKQGNDSFTKLLLHFDGDNASTLAVDASSAAHGAATFAGTTQIATDQSKFGGASLKVNGIDGNFITLPDHDDYHILAADCTIDVWVRYSALLGVGSSCWFTSQRVDNNNQTIFRLLNTGGVFSLSLFHNDSSVTRANMTATITTPTVDQWYHLAMERHGSNANFYVDGVKQTTTVTTAFGTIGNIAAPLGIGGNAASGNVPVPGHMDELRISKGIARYGGLSFTPPMFPYG